MSMINQDFIQGVGDEMTGRVSPLLKAAEEREWLTKVGMNNLTMEEFITAAERESMDFRKGLKEAMLEEGVEEDVVDGLFKEAEEILECMLKGNMEEGMEKSANLWTTLLGRGARAAGNQFMRAVKAPVLEGVAKNRGFSTANQLLENLAPGAVKMGPLQQGQNLVIPEVHRGTLRMGLGSAMEKIPGLRGLGGKVQNWGESAAQRQATNLNTADLVQDFNQNARNMVQQGRTAAGVDPVTLQRMEEFKKMAPGPQNEIAGAVPANTVSKVQSMAERNLGTAPVSARGVSMPSKGHFRFTPRKGLMRGAVGAGLGTMALGPVGGVLGGMGGLATGTLGTGGTLLAGGTLLGANKLLGGSKPKVDESGLPSDRNRVLPFMGNNWTGALGGALLASIIGREMGLSGPLSWLLPLLGGVAGYKFLPGMINSWSDRPGTGVNAVPEIQRRGNAQQFGYTPGA